MVAADTDDAPSDDRVAPKKSNSGYEMCEEADAGTDADADATMQQLQDEHMRAEMTSDAPMLIDFAETPDLDLEFSFEDDCTVDSRETRARLHCGGRATVAPLEIIVDGSVLSDLNPIDATSVSVEAIRPHSATYSVLSTNSSCYTLDTLGTFGNSSRRASCADTFVSWRPASEASWNVTEARRTTDSSRNHALDRRWSDVPEDVGLESDALEDTQDNGDVSAPSLSSTATSANSYLTAQSTIDDINDERRQSADSGTTCVDDLEDTAVADCSAKLAVKVEDAPDICSVSVGYDKSIRPVCPISSLSTPRFALPTPIGSTFFDEDEAVAHLTPLNDITPPDASRNLNRRLLRSSVKRYSRTSTPDGRRQEQKRTSLCTSSSASHLRSDALVTTADRRPAATVAARNLRFKREGVQKSLSPAPQPYLRNNTWLRDIVVGICIDQENFRPVHPLFTLVWVSQKTSDEQDKALQELGISAEKRVLLGGMAEFKPVRRCSYIFHHTTLDASPCLRRITLQGDETREFISRFASLRISQFGVYTVSGVEEHKIITPFKGQQTVQMKWKFEYFVHPSTLR